MLFVGTKKQARDTIAEVAQAADMPYVNHRWLGGLLTNFQTINQRIRRLHDLERYEAEGQLALLPTRERMAAQADLSKLRANLGGVKNMQRVPDAMFVIDLKTEVIAVKEAQRLRIPIIGLVDTNCDPGRHRLRDPGQRRRDPLLRADHPGDRPGRGGGPQRVPCRGGARAARSRGEGAHRGRGAREARSRGTGQARSRGGRRSARPRTKRRPNVPPAAAAAEQPAPESAPVPPAPADPATLEPQTESPTPMTAGRDSRQPDKPQSAPAETAAESAEGGGEAAGRQAAEPPAAEQAPAAEAAGEPEQAEQRAGGARMVTRRQRRRARHEHG